MATKVFYIKGTDTKVRTSKTHNYTHAIMAGENLVGCCGSLQLAEKEIERRQNAFKFEFCNKADILVKSSDDKADRKAPGFGLKEYMEAAAHWSDIVMPNNYMEAERKAIEGPRG